MGAGKMAQRIADIRKLAKEEGQQLTRLNSD
jgi:hypothetical protein